MWIFLLHSVQLIAIPSGRQESAGLLWDSSTFIRLIIRLQHHERPCFPPFITSFELYHPYSVNHIYTVCIFIKYSTVFKVNHTSYSCLLSVFPGINELAQPKSRKFRMSWTWTHQYQAEPYIIARSWIPLPRFVMAYDFTASPLIFHHFCHFSQPPLSHPNTSPLNTSSLHLAHSPPNSHQPSFRHYLAVNILTVSISRASSSNPPGGRSANVPKTPTDM